MKTIINIVALLVFGFASAQPPQRSGPEASVAGLMRFEETAVSNHTGVPNIQIPLLSLPTRNSAFQFNAALAYHPSGIRIGEPSGDCGFGWSLIAGGAIARTIIGDPDENQDPAITDAHEDIYQFNVMGMNGRFYVEKDSLDVMRVRMLENGGERLQIDVDYNDTTEVVNSFTIYDSKGYKYHFGDVDRMSSKMNSHNYFYRYGNTYHLSTIKDNNNKTLLNFSYEAYTQDSWSSLVPDDSFQKLSEIESPGFGTIVIAYREAGYVYDINRKVASLTLKDVFGNFVKKQSLEFSEDDHLDKVIANNDSQMLDERYELYYREIDIGQDEFVPDGFGYPTSSYQCRNDYLYINEPTPDNFETEPKAVMNGTLQKIKLPTGGCIIYDFESNDYAIYDGTALVTSGSHNYNNNVDALWNDEEIASLDFTPDDCDVSPSTCNTAAFTVPGTGTQEIYIHVTQTPYTVPGLSGGELTPSFEITGPGSFSATPTESGNHWNRCIGKKYTVQPGTYTVTIHSHGPDLYGTGNVTVMMTTPIPPPMIGHYGGGVRIKRIGYFDQDEFKGHYQSDLQLFDPVKETNFDYHLFEPGYEAYSSGVSVDERGGAYLNYGQQPPNQDNVNYRNVRVWETGSNGYQDFTYTTPREFGYSRVDSMTVYYDYRRGLLTDHKVYNQSGQILKHDAYTYYCLTEPIQPVRNGDHMLNANSGWTRVSKKVSKTYPDATSHFIKTTEDYTYDDDTRVPLTYKLTTPLGEELSTEYTYHTGNSAYSQNRISEVSEMKNYRGTDLLSTQKITYDDSWAAINEGAQAATTNLSWLPETTELKKANKSSIVKSRILAYDQYGHPVEVQQENGIKIVYIYGYFSSQLVAKIENATLSGITSGLITDIKDASDTNDNEEELLEALDALRDALPDAMVTTYTYRPLIGVSTVTDANGDRQHYEYDDFGRLLRVRNSRNQILSETEYHLAGQD